jgi:signal transduction histidine kinase/CheY-like chemotaxis protein
MNRAAIEGPLGPLARALPLAAGVSASAFGLFVVLRWIVLGENVAARDPGGASGNSAICFFLVGAGLVALHFGRSRTACWLAGLGILFPAILFGQSVLAGPLGLEASTIGLGRMATNAALGLAMAAGALVLLAAGRWLFVAALLGSLATTIGAAALLGFIARAPTSLGWGDLADMALPTAAGMVLLGLALAAIAVARQVEFGPVAGLRRGAMLAGIMAALVSAVFWYALRIEERRHVERNLDRTAHALEREIIDRVQAMARGMTNLARHGAALGWSSPDAWRTDAWLSVSALPDFLAIEWIDSEFTPRLVATIHTPAPDLSPTPESTRLWIQALELARSSREPVVAGPFATRTGESLLRILVPLASYGAGDAYLGGIVSTRQAFAALVDHVAPGYAVHVRCRDETVLRRGGSVADRSPERRLSIDVPGEMPWSIEVTPDSALLASQRSQLPDLALLGGLIIAVLLGSTVWFGEIASRRAEQLEAAVAARTVDLERALGAERLARQDATTASAAKDRFLSIVSHELRNPLGSMRTALEVLDTKQAAGEVRGRMLAILERQVGQLGRLVDDLLDVSRIASGKISLEIDRIDLNVLLRHAVETWRTHTAKTGPRIDAELPDHAIWIDGDPERLTQVVDNLLLNATKATGPGGTIEVRLSETDDGRAEVAVRDDGEGISAEEIDRLFEPFFQSDRARAEQKGGLGLGLAIFKGLVEGHGGSVEVSSDGPSRGAQFVFRLPRKTAPPLAEPPAVAIRPGRLRLLLVDDHRDSLEGLAEMLRLQGHDVLTAADGQAGIDIARRETAERLDAIICDLGLPRIDGYEVARTLRRDPSTETLLVIALSGFGDDTAMERAFEAGFDHHLTTPVDVDRLRDLLARPRPEGSAPARTAPVRARTEPGASPVRGETARSGE